jgi:hypothetical protein
MLWSVAQNGFITHIDPFHPFHPQQGLHSTEVRFLRRIVLTPFSLLTDVIPYSSPQESDLLKNDPSLAPIAPRG